MKNTLLSNSMQLVKSNFTNFKISKLLVILSLILASLTTFNPAQANTINGLNYYSIPMGFTEKSANDNNLKVYQNKAGDFILVNSTSVGAADLNASLDAIKKIPQNQLKSIAQNFYQSFSDLKNVHINDIKVKNIYNHNILVLYATATLNNKSVNVPMFILAGSNNRKIVGLVVSKANGNYLLDQVINSIRTN